MNDLVKEYLGTLKTYVPIVDRVHGALHPEFHDVKRVFEDLSVKIEAGMDVAPLFKELRVITDNYTVPTDVCESYEAVYMILKKLDKALIV
jgi:iron-sulfur cluster repair protein YtfE (RIC family)